MKLYAAPLQGFTESPWRAFHHKFYGGIDAYYTPFVRIEKGTFRNKDIRDLDGAVSADFHTVPQLLASTPAELSQLVELFATHGCKEADINMGCPFPLITGRHKGSGILPYPDEVKALLDELKHYPDFSFSVKMRLGWERCDEWKEILPLLNEACISRIVLHPRIGKQQYKGQVDMEQFETFYKECVHPLVYNGDLVSSMAMERMIQHFPKLEGLMIGRGLLENPALALEFLQGGTLNGKECSERLNAWHEALYRHYEEYLEGDIQILSKMKPFWEYLYPEGERKLRKAIHKANTISKYQTATRQFIDSLAR